MWGAYKMIMIIQILLPSVVEMAQCDKNSKPRK